AAAMATSPARCGGGWPGSSRRPPGRAESRGRGPRRPRPARRRFPGTAPPSSTSGTDPVQVRIGDLNRDGRPDLVVRNETVTIESDGRGWWVVGHQIAARGPPGKARARPDRSEKPRPAPAGRININTATAAELEALPGIGPVIARR